jgi:glycosyltransferase involved in cell wall biosynthesis
VLTCHDLLAVRGAHGEPVYCQPSPTGHILQALILFGLKRASWVACVSAATCADFRRLTGRGDDPHICTIPNAFNAPFKPVAPADLVLKLARFPGLVETPYLLHVGSGEARKNRGGAMRAFAQARPHWPGRLIFAGEPLTDTERAVLRTLDLPADAVCEITHPTHDELAALYSGAHALIFPSFAEGFGWPVIEAQACGCPVICSNATSLPEVAGGAAILCAPDDASGMADAVIALTDANTRDPLIVAGRANIARFSEDIMLDAYADLYRRALI